MTWTTAAASVAGTSHERKHTPCEDAHIIEIIEPNNESPIFLTVVSDGAGSANKGGLGATVATQTSIDFWQARFEKDRSCPTPADMGHSLIKVRERLQLEADQEACSIRDYACTYLCLIVGESWSVAFQIGDGAILLGEENQLENPITPQKCEYANETYFVTDEESELVGEAVWIDQAPDTLAVLTDGLQWLALGQKMETANSTFFNNRFRVLRDNPDATKSGFKLALEKFLRSEAICRHTDDDKTLVIAVRKNEAN
jgi:hypothetical protein